MKKIFLILTIILASFSMQAVDEKPLSFKSTDFPTNIIIMYQEENTWLKKGDAIYAVYQDEGLYYADFDVTYLDKNNGYYKGEKAKSVIIKSFSSDPEFQVKTGFYNDEQIIWALWRNNLMTVFTLSTYSSQGLIFGVGTLTNTIIQVYDNLYYSIDPLWPPAEQMILNIYPPVTKRNIVFYQLKKADNKLVKYPLYLENMRWELYEGFGKVTTRALLNNTLFYFTDADIRRGYIKVKLIGTTLKNSASEDTFRIYTIAWNIK